MVCLVTSEPLDQHIRSPPSTSKTMSHGARTNPVRGRLFRCVLGRRPSPPAGLPSAASPPPPLLCKPGRLPNSDSRHHQAANLCRHQLRRSGHCLRESQYTRGRGALHSRQASACTLRVCPTARGEPRREDLGLERERRWVCARRRGRGGGGRNFLTVATRSFQKVWPTVPLQSLSFITPAQILNFDIEIQKRHARALSCWKHLWSWKHPWLGINQWKALT
jgi:hypothetical protein